MKLGLGTVQFGLDYGIANRGGQTSSDEVARILQLAAAHGIRIVDTAALYGNSETVLGENLQQTSTFDIVTKTAQFTGAEATADAQQLEQVFHQSLVRLRRPAVYGLLVHQADHLTRPGGALLMDKMQELKARGLVRRIGVSVYSAAQIDRVLDNYAIDLIQVPINVFDQRLLHSGHLRRLQRGGIEVHARSAFLQGLLLMTPQSVPEHLSAARKPLESFHRQALERGLSPLQVALGFVAGLEEVDSVICGVNDHRQLLELCSAVQTPVARGDWESFAIDDDLIVNPAEWRSR